MDDYMKDIVGVITKKNFVSDDMIKTVLTVIGGKDPRRLGQAGCDFTVLKPPNEHDLLKVRKLKVDINFVEKSNREKQIVVADMDGTLIKEESLDELSKLLDLRKEVGDLTNRAMQGDMPFRVSIQKRMKLLEGVRKEHLEECFRYHINLREGAEALIKTMNARNALTILVSGGIKYFVSRVARRLKFSSFVSNEVVCKNGILTGELEEPIVDDSTKFDVIKNISYRCGVGFENILAVGDGANDIRMLESVGLGVAFRGKKIVKAATNIHIDHSDLTALLFLQGITEKFFK